MFAGGRTVGHSCEELRGVDPKKRRKLNHAEKKKELKNEIRLLESGLAVLKTRNLPRHLVVEKDPILRPVATELAALLYAKQKQQFLVAKAQGALSSCMLDQLYYPLYSRICLTKNWDERCATLMTMRKQKLLKGYEFVMSPTRIVDSYKTQFSEHRFENADGDMCCVRFDTVHFPGVTSLKQVFDALSFYVTNMEIIISEQLGHVMVRDDDDTIEEEAFLSRYVSTNARGIAVEGNAISFRHLFAENDNGFGSEPCGVFIVDCVDEDELYPYSSNRVRRDSSGAIVLTASRRQPSDSGDIGGASGNDENELVVTMRCATFLKIKRPEFSLPEPALEELHDEVMQWHDVMLKSMRTFVYGMA